MVGISVVFAACCGIAMGAFLGPQGGSEKEPEHTQNDPQEAQEYEPQYAPEELANDCIDAGTKLINSQAVGVITRSFIHQDPQTGEQFFEEEAGGGLAIRFGKFIMTARHIVISPGLEIRIRPPGLPDDTIKVEVFRFYPAIASGSSLQTTEMPLDPTDGFLARELYADSVYDVAILELEQDLGETPMLSWAADAEQFRADSYICLFRAFLEFVVEYEDEPALSPISRSTAFVRILGGQMLTAGESKLVISDLGSSEHTRGTSFVFRTDPWFGNGSSGSLVFYLHTQSENVLLGMVVASSKEKLDLGIVYQFSFLLAQVKSETGIDLLNQ